MAKTAQGAALDRKKLMADPIMVTTIVLLITFLTLFILYPLAILLVDSVLMDGHVTLKIFQRIFTDPTSNFPTAITNTLRLLALPEQVLSMVEEGALSAGHARALLALDGMDW